MFFSTFLSASTKKEVIKFSKRKVYKHRRVLETGVRMRRSLTITEENDKRIQETRAFFLRPSESSGPIDLDYTTTVNMFIELGSMLLWQTDWREDVLKIEKTKVKEVISKYLADVALKDQAIEDMWTDLFYRRLWRFQQELLKPR